MSRLWSGPGPAPIGVIITALDQDGAALRSLHAGLPDGVPLVVELPPGAWRVQVQSSNADPRVRVDLGELRGAARYRAPRPRHSWAMRWRMWRNNVRLRRVQQRGQQP